MGRRISLGAGTLGLWLLLSGHLEPLFLALGLFSSVVVVLLADRMRRMRSFEEPSFTLHLAVRLLLYLPWLIKEVFVSNFAVARIVLARTLRISPTIVHFTGRQKTDLVRFIYANSITLTPGTITIDVRGQDLSIHALTASSIDGHEESEMVERMSKLEEGLES